MLYIVIRVTVVVEAPRIAAFDAVLLDCSRDTLSPICLKAHRNGLLYRHTGRRCPMTVASIVTSLASFALP